MVMLKIVIVGAVGVLGLNVLEGTCTSIRITTQLHIESCMIESEMSLTILYNMEEEEQSLDVQIVSVPREICPQTAGYVILSYSCGHHSGLHMGGAAGNSSIFSSTFETPSSDTAGSPQSIAFHPLFPSVIMCGETKSIYR